MKLKVKQIPIGTKYHKWTVLEYMGEKGSGRNSYWKCRCDCGTIKEVPGSHLRNGANKQCNQCSGKVNGRKAIYAKDKGKHLYMIQAGPYFKIGVSSNPDRRIKDIQSDCPLPIQVLYIGFNEGDEEEMWHIIFKHRQCHGEWFTGVCEVI